MNHARLFEKDSHHQMLRGCGEISQWKKPTKLIPIQQRKIHVVNKIN